MRILALIFTMLLADAVLAQGIKRDFQALVIGANQSFVKSEETLKYATDDAKRVARALRTASRLPHGYIQQLDNPTVKQFKRAISKIKKNNTKKFLFYYSGHSDENGLHLKDGSIDKDTFHKLFKAVPSKVKVAILDSCFSGALKAKGVRRSEPIDLVQYNVDEPTGSVILTSSSGEELSYESEKLKGSIFTYHLTSGLYGQADGNKDGVVTIDELYQYVYSQTKYQSMMTGGRVQSPEFISKLKGQGALVISYPDMVNGTIRLPKSMYGELTLASSNGVTFFKFNKNRGEEKLLRLPRGGYQVSLREPARLGKGNIELLNKETIQLSSNDFKWEKAKKMRLQSKGMIQPEETSDIENEFLFGLAVSSHQGYNDEKDEKGGASEFFMYSPYFKWIGTMWRGSVHAGGHQYKLEGSSEETEQSRFTLGIEAGWNGFSSWRNHWLAGLRLGGVTDKDETATSVDLNIYRLSVGTRFYPKGWPVQLGGGLSYEAATNRDSGDKFGDMVSLDLNISF